ncbi:hypothetical protein [Accumulibacter sp.]|uniref:hypothetical protein n=1 Tax=Accumulibacter sp. TaxID=2053492 RepID=UPI0035B141BB
MDTIQGMRMTDQELSAFLATKGAAVVHLSHHAVMDPARPIWPEDMRRAIAKKDDFNLSCVVVWPGHRMPLPGSVGVIFKPTCANVVSASSSDSGSTMLPDGSDGSAGFPLSPETLASTFDVWNGTYNEWRVRGAEVVGIFVADPSNIEVKKDVVLNAGGHEFKDVAATSITMGEVFAAFPHHSVFTMGPAGMIEIPRS